MIQERPRTGVDIRPRILRLPLLLEHLRDDLVEPVDDPVDRIIRADLLPEIEERREARIGHPQDRVAVARDHLAGLERVPAELPELRIGGRAVELLLEREHEPQALLVRQTVQRTREAVQTGRDGVVDIRESRSDRVRGDRGDVAALVIAVEHQVEADQPREVAILIRQAEHARVVRPPVELRS